MPGAVRREALLTDREFRFSKMLLCLMIDNRLDERTAGKGFWVALQPDCCRGRL